MFSFIETRLFTKLVLDYLSDEEYFALQESLMRTPEAGPVIPAGCGSSDGALQVEVSAVATASFTTFAAPTGSFGC